MTSNGDDDRGGMDIGLTNLELRMALATALGYRAIKVGNNGTLSGSPRGMFTGPNPQIPDWTGDLGQAMGIETAIELRGLVEPYLTHLARITCPRETDRSTVFFRMVHASARQRCEAALLVFREIGM